MLKTRLIPVLLLQSGVLVRSEEFSIHQVIGNPVHEAERFNEWNVDELIYIDITRDGDYDLRRGDAKIRDLADPLAILSRVAETCFMPLTWGGRIRTLDDMQARFERGADKITINTAALDDPSLITAAANRFGSQAIVVSIDARRGTDGQYRVVRPGTKGAMETATSLGDPALNKNVVDWAIEAESRGAGEIFLQSVDRDGTAEGYDVDLIAAVCESCEIPVICCGGVGTFEDYAEGVDAGASAVAAANLWHFKELADRAGKRALAAAGVPVRTPAKILDDASNRDRSAA